MRITGPSSTPSTGPSRRAKDKGGARFETTGETGAARRAGGAAPTVGVSSVDALLALQGEDSGALRERATGRAFTLLDILDEIKIALLEGGLPRAKLTELLGALNVTRDDTRDARLESVLDEVETRARVELAKHESLLS